jgi:hypothetical protein
MGEPPLHSVANGFRFVQSERIDRLVCGLKNQKGRVFSPALLTENNVKF